MDLPRLCTFLFDFVEFINLWNDQNIILESRSYLGHLGLNKEKFINLCDKGSISRTNSYFELKIAILLNCAKNENFAQQT